MRAEMPSQMLFKVAVDCSDAIAMKYSKVPSETASAVVDAALLKCEAKWQAAAEQSVIENGKRVQDINGSSLYREILDAAQKMYRKSATILVFELRSLN